MFTLFDTKKTKQQKVHMRNLVVLAKIDGYISDSEIELIFKIGKKNGLREFEVQELLDDSSEFDFVKPSKDSERFEQLFDMIQLMLVDGKVKESEMDFCIDIANKLGFRKAITGVLVRKITMDLLTGLDKELIREQSADFLEF